MTKKLLFLSTLSIMLIAFFSPQKAKAQWTSISVNSPGGPYGGSSCLLPDTMGINVQAFLTGTAVPGDSVTFYFSWGDGSDTTIKDRDTSFYYHILYHAYTFPGTFTQYCAVTSQTGVVGTWVNPFPTTITNTCAPITGRLYVDNNHNCLQDAGELGIPSAPVFLINTALMDTTLYGWTNDSGYYSIVAPAGSYTILANPAYAYSLFWPATAVPTGDVAPSCPVNGLYSLTTTVGGTYSQDFADTCAPVTALDVVGSGCIYGSVPGDTTWLQVYEGAAWWFWDYTCNTFTSTLTLTLDPHLHYAGYSTVPPTTISGSTLTWNVSSVAGYFAFYPRIKVYTDVSATMGSTVSCTVNATPTSFTDPNMPNNTQVITRTVTSSWDPNEVAVSPQGSGAPGYITNNTELTYTIHFQNTGTAAARNITVIDTTSSNLDLRTVHILSSSSPVDMYQAGNLLKFRFNNINLPDSMSNPNGSIGSVTYSVLPKQGLAPGTQIYNRANIFFDYNEGVKTNRVLNTISSNVGVSTITPAELKAVVYPNPAGNELFARLDDQSDFTVTVCDLLGRVLYNGSSINGIASVNTSTIANGIYLVKLRSANGNELTTKALVQH